MTKKQLFWWIVLILLIASLLGGAAYAIYYFYYLPNQEPAESENQNPPAEEGPKTQQVSGEFVRGEVPQDWTIVEYKNGQGTSMITSDINYTGLTALEVKNPAGQIIFALRAVNGIGGPGGCKDYFRFADDSSSYYNQILTETDETIGTPTIVNLNNSQYSSINLFGLRVRRVDTKLYWDVEPADKTTFSAGCGISEAFFNFQNLQFTFSGVGEPSSSGVYSWIVLSSATTEDLTKLDAILNSLTVNP